MAHHPNKFVSINLNRSYGPQPQRHSSSVHGRARPASGGSGGGMVVLSRPRSSGSSSSASSASKSAVRFAVPPPLNLPSIRKENERLDPSATAAVSSGRPGSGHGSSALGWTRSSLPPPADQQSRPQSTAPIRVVEKAAVLLGEDFPTLSATVASEQKQRVFLSQRQKQQQADGHGSHSPLHMRPQLRSSQLISSTAADKMEPIRPVSAPEPLTKLDSVLPGPLPVIRLTHTNNWADDERDTGFSIPGREHDSVYSRTETIRGLELPNGFSSTVRDADVSSAQARDFFTGDSSGRDLSRIRDSRDVSSWRSQMQPGQRSGLVLHEAGGSRERMGTRPIGVSRGMSKENNAYATYSDNVRDTSNSTGQDSWYARRDVSSGINIPNGRYVAETTGMRGSEQSYPGKYSDSSSNWFKKDTFQNGSASKSQFSSGNKGFSLNDPILNSAREKRLISSSAMPYLEDAVIGSIDLLEDMNIKVLKRKKEIYKQADFHDPVRESFEAELERVQRLQELERKKVMEEQARVLELACKEREEKERLAREEEDRRYRLEEEAKEAAWRAERERLELEKIAQKQKFARAEEKRLMLMEEDRRKEAARQKLLELEERIARRQAEDSSKGNGVSASDIAIGEQIHVPVNNMELPRTLEYGGLDDSERQVEHMKSNTSEFSVMNRFSNTYSRSSSSNDGKSMAFTERAKHGNYRRRDADAYGNRNNSAPHVHELHSTHRQTKRGVFISGIGMSRQDYHNNSSMMSLTPSSGGERADPSKTQEDLHPLSGERWSHFGTVDADHWNRASDVDAELLDNFGGNGHEPDHGHGTSHAGYEENLFHSSDVDGFSSGRSRYSLKQPRVLPPPSISSMQKNSFRGAGENTISSFLDDEVPCHHVSKNAGDIINGSFEGSLEEGLRQTGSSAFHEENAISELQEDTNGLRCDSQSSLSVSSPPNSPTHLSHDDMDECGDSPVIKTHDFGSQISVSDKEHVESSLEVVDSRIIVTSNSVFPGEEDEWAIEENGEMRIQDEYEENDGYEEEDEAQEDDENTDLVQELDDLQFSLQETGASDNLVGFNEAAEVRMPIDDEREGTSRDVVKAISHSAGPTDAAQGLFDDVDVNLHLDNSCPEKILKDSSIMVNEIKNTLEELVLDPVVSSCLSESVETSPNTAEVSTSKPNLPPLSLPTETSPSVHPISSPTSSGISQTEGSTKLQFGLFSGPSLIPTPLPAIQIGSIHMPLHLQPQGGPIANRHSSQPPMFQFGQLRYLQPISQGILPLAPQALSIVQRPSSTQYSLNHNLIGSFPSQTNIDSSTHNIGDRLLSHPLDKRSTSEMKPIDLSRGCLEHTQLMSTPDGTNNVSLASRSQAASLPVDENLNRYASGARAICHAPYNNTVRRNRRFVGDGKNPQMQLHAEPISTQFFPRDLSGSRASGLGYGGRGRRLAYAVRNTGARSSFQVADTSYANSDIFHKKPRKNISKNVRRTEFRVRDTSDKRPTESLELHNSAGNDEMDSTGKMSEITAGNGGRRDADSSTSASMIASERRLNSDAFVSSVVGYVQKIGTSSGRESASNRNVSSMLNPHDTDGKRNGNSEEEVDVPFQSGFVCVFKQPGIEVPSDEDDFIQVRSKRQMLNDRREQREKDIKAKSRLNKGFRKNHTIPQDSSATFPKRAIASLPGGHAGGHSDPLGAGGRSLSEIDRSPVFTANLTSQTLAPIGTPVLNADTVGRSKKLTGETKSTPGSFASSGETKSTPGSSLRNKRTPFGNRPDASWEKRDINKQVMALTQTQLDEAIKPANFELHDGSSVASGPRKSAPVISEPTQPSPSILMQENLFSSSKDTNSLFSGEKIQFGAVTSPVIPPPVMQFAVDGVCRPGSCRSDASIEHNMSGKNNVCTAIFEKEKNQDDSCTQIEDSEAEAAAEAAASAVAVAAISSCDELVGRRLGVSVSVSDAKSFGTSDASRMPSIVTREMTCQSSEESLSVSLPADLSDDNPALSLWPPIPSPHGSGSLLSHFPGALPSHFPCFEVNPIVEAPLFAFGPHDESAVNQAEAEAQGQAQLQARRSMTIGSGPVGPWPHCHSGVDSFYGPPAGFTGPFINPTGIPGIQGPPHMIVYNHFTPVGQFGQVGLSYMGTTYIPTGKQPDWKHTPSGVSEGDASNISVVSGQCNPLSMPAPLPHVAHGSPLIPMSSQLTMFDMPPFQSSAELPVQARWSHIPPPVHALPLSMPLQQPQTEGGAHSQFSHKVPLDKNKPTIPTQINDSHPSRQLDLTKIIPVTNDVASQFPDELVLVDAPVSTSVTIASDNSKPSYNNVCGNNKVPSTESSVIIAADSGIDSSISLANNGSGKTVSMSSKRHTSQQNDLLGHGHLARGRLEHRVEAHQRIGSGVEWHRKTGYRGRHQNYGSGSFGPSKVRQIYVAKQPANGHVPSG